VLLGEPLDAPPQVPHMNAQALDSLLLLGEFGLGLKQPLVHLLGLDRARLERAESLREHGARLVRAVESVDGAHASWPRDHHCACAP